MNDSLGDRMKRFEDVSRIKLTPRTPVIIRVDGKAFHTWTKRIKANRPYDYSLIDAMVETTQFVSRNMSGFKLAYTQSDEASFLITDYDKLDTQGWFDYNLSKLISVTASAFTAAFNTIVFRSEMDSVQLHELAMFDCRAFSIPEADVPNYFLWRQKDWVRNSVAMLAQANFSPKQLHGKKQADMHEMLHGIGVNWADLDDTVKNGTYVLSQRSLLSSVTPSYQNILGLLDGAFGTGTE